MSKSTHENWARIHHNIDSVICSVLSRPQFNISVGDPLVTIRSISHRIQWKDHIYLSSLYAHSGYSMFKVYAFEDREEEENIFFSMKFQYQDMKSIRKTALKLVHKIQNRLFFDILNN